MSDLLIRVGALEFGRLGFGAMRITGPGSLGEPADRDAAIALLRRAVELGVNFIDTADSYGPGVSEVLIYDALHPYPDDLVIATKGGFLRVAGVGPPWPSDCRPERLRAACDASLRRLGLETIPLYQLHTVDPGVPFAESLGALIELRDAGKIAHIGLSNVGRRHLSEARAMTEIASVQNRYSILDRSAEKLLEECERQGIVFIPWGPLSAGITDAQRRSLAEIAEELRSSVSQVALAWLLHRSPWVAPIPGTSRVEHLEENLAAASVVLNDDHTARLDALGA